tara:strand:+ start:513 stop:902 length:390 start_codon:yes stop_codon:yes gene_type:complete
MNNDKTIDGYDLSGVSALHGLTLDQYYSLLKHQNFKCPISGFQFVYSKYRKKFVDSRGDWMGRGLSKKAPPLDHCHDTGYIRGIVSENLNRLLDQWRHNTYGSITRPIELEQYEQNPPAYSCIGKVHFK